MTDEKQPQPLNPAPAAPEQARVGVFQPPPAPIDPDAARRAADRDGVWSARPSGQGGRRRFPYSIVD